jgi:multiple sugar transport system ATP-binding protein
VAGVRLENVGKAYGETRVLSGLDLDVAPGEFLVLVGPSGCGKSTALRLVAGLDEPTEGTISIGGRVVNGVPPRERDIAMVFQSYALYPHMTVRENLSFGLEMRKVPRLEAEARLRDAAEYLGLTPYLDRTPRQLSGGQRQRVALGRALVRRPEVFLFDEPLSNLDAALRVQMRAELARLQERYATTSIYVTHDQVEAMTLGHRIAVLNGGILQQVGPPLDVYRNPGNLFVAGFLGTPAINRLEARADDSGATLAGDGFALPVPPGLREVAASRAGLRVVVGIRPEHLHEEPAPGRAPLRIRVAMVEPLGYEVIVHGRVGGQPGTPVAARVAAARPPEAGASLELHAEIAALLLFDAESGRRLPAA